MRFALTLFFTLTTAGAADPVAVTIERAQGLAISKNRVDAAALLRRALESNPSRAARTRLREALGQVSRVFFTDKGQRAFETGQTVLFETPDLAAARLREAVALENGNILVRLTLAKYYLLKQDCAAARTEVAASRAMNPDDGDGAALELRTTLCDHEFEGMRDKVRALPPLSKWQETFVLFVQARAWLHQGLNGRAGDALARVIAEAPRFPEARFYLARAQSGRGGGEESLRKYVNLCKALTERDRREFALEPRVCVNQKEAEVEMAKKAVDL